MSRMLLRAPTRPWAAVAAGAACLACHAAPAVAATVVVAPTGDVATINLAERPSTNVGIRLYVYDPDFTDEGTMTINGHAIDLFGSAGVAANSERLLWVGYTTPAWYWQAGKNTVVFSYTRRDSSYRVDSVQVDYADADMPVVQMFKAAGRAPAWLDEDDDIRIRLHRNPDRVYLCATEDGAPGGRRFAGWSPGDQVTPDFSQPLAPIDACDIAICFAANDATSTRAAKIVQACGS